MAYNFDPATRKITLPAGDTMDFRVHTNGEYDHLIFAVYNKSTGQDVLTVPAEIEDGYAHVRLANRHTRDLQAGTYKWNLRMVTDPEVNADGSLVIDEDTDNVLTVFGPENDDIPTFVIRRNGAYV